MLLAMSRNPEEPVYNRIEEARVALGLSRQDLAEKAGVHYQTIGYLAVSYTHLTLPTKRIV